MNTHEQKKLSESLLAACKAAGIEEPRYIVQGASLSVYHSEHDPRLGGGKGRLYNYSQALCIDHPPYADDWQDSLLEFREYALIRKCNKCLSVTAIDLIGNDENEKELQHDGETVFRVSKEDAHGAVVNLCKCDCKPQVENFNLTKSAAMAKWRESFGFIETEKQQIKTLAGKSKEWFEQSAIIEGDAEISAGLAHLQGEPLADVLARHPESFTIENEFNEDGEVIAHFIRNHHGNITEMIRPDHIADTSKKVSDDDACKLGYRKMIDEYAGRRTKAQAYECAWQDALAWKAMAEKGGEKL